MRSNRDIIILLGTLSAYLLFTQKESMEAKNILLFSTHALSLFLGVRYLYILLPFPFPSYNKHRRYSSTPVKLQYLTRFPIFFEIKEKKINQLVKDLFHAFIY